MTAESRRSLEAGPEQLLYAGILEKGMFFGLIVLLVTYALYIFGIVGPYIPRHAVPQYWGLSVSDYLHEANIQAGWAWLGMLRYGDFLNFVGIVTLSAVTIVCFLSIIPTLLRNGDRVYAVLAALEAIILTVAASGILGSGGH